MSTTQIEAIERGCDKRHSRLMEYGLSEIEASKKVVEYLKNLDIKYSKRTNCGIHHFILNMIDAYSAKLPVYSDCI